MSSHPIEALLRPPVELWSTLVAFATAAIALLAPWTLMMPPGVAFAAGAALTLLGRDPRPAGLAGAALPAQHAPATHV